MIAFNFFCILQRIGSSFSGRLLQGNCRSPDERQPVCKQWLSQIGKGLQIAVIRLVSAESWRTCCNLAVKNYLTELVV